MSSTRNLICVRDYGVSLTKGFAYRALPDDAEVGPGLVRINDNTGEDYLFPAEWFVAEEEQPVMPVALKKMAALHPMSDEDRERQRISFAFGNLVIDRPDLTKDDIMEAAAKMKAGDKPVIEPGLYRHYKGKPYSVLGVVRHSETLEWLCCYWGMYDGGEFWARPAQMFLDEVEWEGKTVKRFTKVILPEWKQ